MPNWEAVGVKQRQSRLQVKVLIVEPRPFAAGEAAGRVDEWVKWSPKPSEGIASTLESDLRQVEFWAIPAQTPSPTPPAGELENPIYLPVVVAP